MALWCVLRCDYRLGKRICARRFATTLFGPAAIREAGSYGWTVGSEIRCPEHKGLEQATQSEATT